MADKDATTTTDTVPASTIEANDDTSFVEAFAGKMERGELPTDRGRAKNDRLAAALSGEKKDAPKAKNDDSTEDDDAEHTDADPADTEEDSSDSAADDSDDDATDDDDAADPSGDKPAADDDVEEETDDADEDDEPEDEDTKLANDARALLTKHGLKMTLDDVPKEARPLVQKRLTEVTAAVTRALQEGRSYRADERKTLAEKAYIEENPDLHIWEMLEKDPELLARVQERLNETETDTGKESLRRVADGRRSDASKALDKQMADTERVKQRGDEISTYLSRAAQKLDLPYEILEEAVLNKIHENPGQDVTEKDLDTIIGRTQKLIGKVAHKKKVDTQKQNIRDRAKDRKTATPATKTGADAPAPRPTGKKAPKTDDEFAAHMEAKLAGR